MNVRYSGTRVVRMLHIVEFLDNWTVQLRGAMGQICVGVDVPLISRECEVAEVNDQSGRR